MAPEELSHWCQYLESRKEDLPKPDYEIDEKELSKLRENFDRFKVRNQRKLIVFHFILGQENHEGQVRRNG